MNNYIVYMHITPNNKRYIGLTSNSIKKRWRSGHGYDNQIFGKAIKKYGWNNIKHIIVAKGLTEDEAEWLESEMIKIYNTTNYKYGYNISPGGNIMSEETKEKISYKLKGRIFNEEHKRKISLANTGRIVSNETKEKLRAINLGKTLSPDTINKIRIKNIGHKTSEETKEKISKSNKGKIVSEETRKKQSESRYKAIEKYGVGFVPEAKQGKEHPRSRSVICTTTMTVFDTISQAEKFYNIKNVSMCCKGTRSFSGKTPEGGKMYWFYLNVIKL